MRENGFLGYLQSGDRLLSRHRREVREEFRKRLTFLQVIHESLEGNPGADEDRSTPKNVRIAVNWSRVCHGLAPADFSLIRAPSGVNRHAHNPCNQTTP